MQAEIYFTSGAWPGRLAVAPRPRGGDWLEDEARSWRRSGVDVVVSALTSDEVANLALSDEQELLRSHDIIFVSFPIVDRTIPTSQADVGTLVERLARFILDGKNVLIHCRQGIGRSALIAACVLVALGVSADTALEEIAKARGCPVPETIEQRRWIKEFETVRL
jgi:protein-tyrosine phosphatase